MAEAEGMAVNQLMRVAFCFFYAFPNTRMRRHHHIDLNLFSSMGGAQDAKPHLEDFETIERHGQWKTDA